MRCGSLRHKIVIEENTPSSNGDGTFDDSWSNYVTLRAEAEPKGGRELFKSEQFFAKISTVFKVRYYNGIIPAMRINWNSRIFNILSSINTMEQNRELIIACEEDV